MDLTTVQSKLEGDVYSTPKEFADDVRLIFQNSKAYNTNKRSKVFHSATLTFHVQDVSSVKEHVQNSVAFSDLHDDSSSVCSVRRENEEHTGTVADGKETWQVCSKCQVKKTGQLR